MTISAFLLSAALFCHVPLGPGQVRASWYGDECRGKPMAMPGSGPFNPDKMTCAHRTLPFKTLLRVRNAATGKAVVVMVTDRGPAAWTTRELDLSRAAFKEIADLRTGEIAVTITKL